MLNRVRIKAILSKKPSDSKGTHVNIKLSGKHNQILESSKAHNSRTKRAEAQARLEHHLELFGVNWEVPKSKP
ncbi:TraY domain-containing protein [Vibrio vulnificus]|nr:TraY domain-containing protein [Vibrio vulnificus]